MCVILDHVLSNEFLFLTSLRPVPTVSARPPPSLDRRPCRQGVTRLAVVERVFDGFISQTVLDLHKRYVQDFVEINQWIIVLCNLGAVQFDGGS